MTDSDRRGPGSIRVAIGSPGKTLFERLSDPRVEKLGALPPTESLADWVVFPCSQDMEFLKDVSAPLLKTWLASAQGRARIVLDRSGEGKVHDADVTNAVHRFLHDIGAEPGVGVLVTQDRTYREDYLSFCAAHQIRPVLRILTYDYYIRRLFAEYEDGPQGLFEERLAAFQARSAHRDRRFISLNLTPRPTKVLFLLRLLRDGLWGAGYISFGGFDLLKATNRGDGAFPRFLTRLRKLPGFRDLTEELLPFMPELESYGEVLFGDIRRNKVTQEIRNLPIGDAALAEHDRAWFTIVTESEMQDRPVRITEKPFKALLNFHPLILLGNPGSLKALRDYGFATFEGFFDETYDEEPDPRARFEMVYREVERLCALDEDDLRRLEQSIADRLAHNCRWGLTGLPAVFRDEIDVALVDQILDVRVGADADFARRA